MSYLSGKTALVTGASRGIGRASALALAKAGAQVLVHYGNSEKEADAVVAEIRKAGGRADKVGADLRQADGPHILAKRVRAIVGEEQLHTENSHKFTIDSFAQLAARAGWSVANTWISDEPRVAMFRLEPRP
jgi:NAD(P)-dependent dehydrogenase (short-subunit alcohol dehydrogenase family)